MVQKRRRHPQPPLGPRGPSLERILQRAEALFAAGRFEEALEVLEEAPPHLQRTTEVLLLKGLILTALDELPEALPLLEEAYQRSADHPAIAVAMGRAYLLLGMIGHGLRTLRPVVPHLDDIPEPGLVEEIRNIVARAEEDIRRWADTLGISGENMEEALYQTERALRFAEADDLSRAIQAVRSASRLAPEWAMPVALEMELVFATGQLREAIRLAEQYYARHPDDPLITLLLARYSIARGDRDRARDLVHPIRSRRLPNVQVLEEAVRVFGLLEDDQALYDLYRKHRKMLGDIQSTFTLVVLGSAAANLGDFRTAQNLWDKALDREVPESETAPLFQAARRGAPGPGLCTRYPTHFPAWVLPRSVLNEHVELINEWSEGEIGKETFRRRLRSLLDRAPLAFDYIVRDFRELRAPVPMAEILILIGTPEALEEVRRFVFSQMGEFAERLAAAQLLVEAGVLDPFVELWEERHQEWRPFIVPPLNWEGDVSTYLSPQARSLMEQVAQAIARRQWEEALEITRQLIALEPDNPAHYQTMGTTHAEIGDPENARKYFQKVIEIDPQHIFARSSLALGAIEVGDLVGARRHLEAVARKRPFTRPDLATYLNTLGALGLAEENLAYARFCIERGLELGIASEMFRAMLWEVEDAEMAPYLERYRQEARRREEKKRRQPISADASLSECLGRLTKDDLNGMARELRMPYNIRKALLIEQMAKVLTDPEILRERVQHLSDQERQALRDVLEAGGILSWDEFASRYDQDLDENSYWMCRKPETVMGRLRFFGLLADGTVDDEFVVLIPRELRSLLPPLLAEETTEHR